jgi:glutamyl-tRNA reductase
MEIFVAHTDVCREEIEQYTFIKYGEDAIRHLYSVAAGIDSQILGDYEIVRQIKTAFAAAKENNMVSGALEKIVSESLKASKQVRANTSISDGTTSISYAVVKLLKAETAQEPPQNICLMGLGKIGALTLKNLTNYAPDHNLTLINRDESKAEMYAADYDLRYAREHEQDEVLKRADILIVATGADHPLITKQHILQSDIKLIFDLSVPSNVCPEVKKMDGIKLFDIDQLSRIVDETVEKRQKQIPQALQIIEANIEEYKVWKKRRSEYLVKLSEQTGVLTA